jgi:hypothetical protein
METTATPACPSVHDAESKMNEADIGRQFGRPPQGRI